MAGEVLIDGLRGGEATSEIALSDLADVAIDLIRRFGTAEGAD